jgi:ATP-binding cassette subfamily F protein uup
MRDLLDADVSRLSGGQAKRVALARALVMPSDLLILDEPTNHLDIDAIAWLEDRLASYRGALVIVTHDRHVLDRVATKVLELDRGRGHLHDGGYDAYLEGRAEREERAAAAESTRRNLARKELAWLRRGAPARTSKPKARIDAATALIETRAEPAARQGIPDLYFGTPRLGDKVVELADVGFAHPGHDPLFDHLDLLIDNRERLGLVGPNGAGKSTLLDVIAGRRAPTSGVIDYGSTVRIGYYDQVGVTLDPRQRVRDAITGGHRAPDWQDAALLESFWFDADAQFAPIELLSGGERRRLQLLLVLAQKPNVLLLDEPTNDLDIDTLRVLEEFLDDWPGALIVVSHDRAFLERTVADVIVTDGGSTPSRRPGGYAAWEDERRAGRIRGRLGTDTSSRRDDRRTERSAHQSDHDIADRDEPSTRSPSTLRFLLKDLEKDIARLTKRRAALEVQLTEVATTGDHARMTALGDELAPIIAELDVAEDRWLELSEEADRAASGSNSRRR